MTVDVEISVPAQRPAPDSPYAADWALVDRAQTGDAEAFGQLYRRHHNAVFLFVLWRVKRRWLAEELTADVFVRALRSLPRVRYTGHAYAAWLMTVARNLVADYHRQAGGNVRVEPTEFAHVLDGHRATSVPSAEDDVVRDELAAAVRRAVAKLPPKQREVVVLRFLHELSISETAAVVGSNEGAVKALQFRAVHTLRRIAPELEAWR